LELKKFRKIITTNEDKRRFLSFLEMKPNCGCWFWMGAVSKGYGNFSIKAEGFQAHRVSFHLFNGPLLQGLQIDHLCRNKLCVRPDHLEQVSARENTLRGRGPSAINAKRTNCNFGHALSGDNLLMRKDGSRRCKKCQAMSEAAYRAKLAKGPVKCTFCPMGFESQRAVKIHSTKKHARLVDIREIKND
jgi:hypothetical protein